jgi:thiol-disulfide isomerase/thioredoxin
MKHSILFYFLVLCLPFAAFSQQKINEITANIEGVANATTKIVGTFGDQNYIADTAVIDAKGQFILTKELPMGWYMALLPGNLSFQFLVGKETKFKIMGKSTDLLNTLQAEGSIDNQLLYDNLRYQDKMDKKYQLLSEQLKKATSNTLEYTTVKKEIELNINERKTKLLEIKSQHPTTFFTAFKMAGQNPEVVDVRKPNGDLDSARQVQLYRRGLWENIDFADESLLRTPVVANKLRRYLKELTPQNPDSLIIASDWLLQKALPHKEYFKFFANNIALTFQNGKTTVMDGEAVMVYVIQKYFTPERAFWSNKEELDKIQKQAWELEASLMGKKGPDVAALDINGKMKSIYEITEPLIVIFMFSPDCEHCREQAPEIERLAQKWKGKGVEFFGIGVNTKQDEWSNFIKKSNFSFTNVFDPTYRAIYAKYYVDNTPELYVLNKNRTIIAKNLNANQLETIFEREFKKMGNGF